MEEILTIRLPDEIRKMLNRTPDEMSRDVVERSKISMGLLSKSKTKATRKTKSNSPRNKVRMDPASQPMVLKVATYLFL